MLSSILPGLRELRTPLAVGYIWLLSFLPIIYADRGQSILSAKFQGFELSQSLVREWQPLVVAIMTFAAYIIGLVSVGLTAILTPKYGVLKFSKEGIGILYPDSVTDPLEVALKREFVGRVREPNTWLRIAMAYRYETLKKDPSAYLSSYLDEESSGHQRHIDELSLQAQNANLWLNSQAMIPTEIAWKMVSSAVDIFEYTQRLAVELVAVSQQILGREEKLYDSFDRQRSEGEFRIGVSVPIAVLAFAWLTPPQIDLHKAWSDKISFTSTQNWVFVGILILALTLYRLGKRSYASAMTLLANAVVAKRVEVDFLRIIDEPEIEWEENMIPISIAPPYELQDPSERQPETT